MPNKNYHTLQPDFESAIDRSARDFPVAEVSDEDRYFQTHSPPAYLGEVEQQIGAFVAQHSGSGRRVVLVTSGGTTVPLENNTVRFIDNFSAGTRGATLAEYFLEQGYAVVFLHREFSLLPYSRHYSHSTNCFLDFMEERGLRVEIKPDYADQMLVVLRKYKQATASDTLLPIPFTTVNQYLYTLRSCLQQMLRLQDRALFYLAAAVSDFFLPLLRMPTHKIQSQPSGKLVVDLEAVPKFLRRLVDNWAPQAMIVLFKLETDTTILIGKAQEALRRYHHQLVIGNLLQTRKREVVFVSADGSQTWYRLPEEDADSEIESIIVPAVVEHHDRWMEKAEQLQ